MRYWLNSSIGLGDWAFLLLAFLKHPNCNAGSFFRCSYCNLYKFA